jgi:hypothetical protein
VPVGSAGVAAARRVAETRLARMRRGMAATLGM